MRDRILGCRVCTHVCFAHPGHVRKLPVTRCQAVFFAGCTGFLHHIQLANCDLVLKWQKKVTKTTFQNSRCNHYALPLFQAVDVGGSMFVHAFGAYFGLAVARVLYKKDIEDSRKEGAVYHSDVFAMIGKFGQYYDGAGVNGKRILPFTPAPSYNAVEATIIQ